MKDVFHIHNMDKRNHKIIAPVCINTIPCNNYLMKFADYMQDSIWRQLMDFKWGSIELVWHSIDLAQEHEED